MSRVSARRGIPRGAVSRVFIGDDFKHSESFQDNKNLYIKMDDTGELTAESPEGSPIGQSWISSVHLAGDIHSANAELYGEGRGTWRLRTSRDVMPGRQIEVWFAADVLAQLNMPFLTPKNIIGRNNYQCHECTAQFEQPNPLKLHLFLLCQSTSSAKFWRKFLKCYEEASFPLNLSTYRPDTRIMDDELMRPKSRDSFLFKSSEDFKIGRCFSEPPFSAFRPYNTHIYNDTSPIQLNNNTHHILSSLPISHPAFLHLPRYTLLPTPHANFNHLKTMQNLSWNNLSNIRSGMRTLTKSLDQVNVNDAVEVETFATNWGKSKEGHLCIYCGKVYSRKYGLKIHIRTHTGYKPLQCKYCLRPFGDPSNLNKHVRLHAQSETPYNCNLCGKMLVRKRDLERHLRSRHGDDPEVQQMELKDMRETPSP